MTSFHYANTTDSNLLYLLQHKITDPVFFLATKEQSLVFLSDIDIEAFADTGAKEVTPVSIRTYRTGARGTRTEMAVATAEKILAEFAIGKELSVPASFPLALADGLRERGYTLSVSEPWCPKRSGKKEGEVSAIKATADVVVGAYQMVEDMLEQADSRDGELYLQGEQLTSEYLRRTVEHYLLEHECASNAGMVISCGKDAAKPHAEGSGPLRAGESIIVDLFPQSLVTHYYADMTRTYVKGQPRKELQAMYTAVSEAKAASLDALRPGMPTKELYEVSASVIRKHGFDVGEKGYIHSLGHGVGVSVHEAPSLAPQSDEVLEPGNVVTIEPGLYYPDIGGVRIEDTVVVTKDGHLNVTDHPERWIIE